MKHLKILSSISAIAALSLAATGCSSSAEDPKPSPTVTVTQTPEPEVREVVPDSCKEYITLSESAFEHAATLTESQGDALIYMLNKAELGDELNDYDILILADYMDSMTAASDGIKSIEEDILSTKSGCIGDSDNV